MKKSRFNETQIVSTLKEADAGAPIKEIWRRCRCAKTGMRSRSGPLLTLSSAPYVDHPFQLTL